MCTCDQRWLAQNICVKHKGEFIDIVITSELNGVYDCTVRKKSDTVIEIGEFKHTINKSLDELLLCTEVFACEERGWQV